MKLLKNEVRIQLTQIELIKLAMLALEDDPDYILSENFPCYKDFNMVDDTLTISNISISEDAILTIDNV